MQSSLKHALGQKFVVGFSGTEVSPKLRKAIETYHFGNIILFRENLVDEAQTRKLCHDLSELIEGVCGVKPFITIDQEGGMVTRLADDSLNIPGAMALASTRDLELTKRLNYANGRILRDLGFHINLAPVLDVNNEAENPVIGIRSYSDQPEMVAEFGVAAIKALQAAGIIASAKHFPGHGDTNVDSHLGLPRVEKPREELERVELLPFRRAVDAGVEAIMTSHILFPALEPANLPATMSRRILTGLLREEMGFEGLILSDCMEMDAIAREYGTVQGGLKAFAAGVDLLFISHTLETAAETFEACLAAYENGELPLDEMEASCARIAQAKAQFQPSELSAKDKEDYRKLIQVAMPQTFCAEPQAKAIQDFPIDEKTVVLGPKPQRVSNVGNKDQDKILFSKVLAKAFGGLKSLETSIEPSEEEIAEVLEATKQASSIILGTYNAHTHSGQKKLLKALEKTGKKLLVVALRNPYDLMEVEKGKPAIAIFEYSEKALNTLISCLKGEKLASGTLPVSSTKTALL